MRTAEDFMMEADPSLEKVYSDDLALFSLAEVKAIQYDAWRQGMADAGDIVIRTRMRFPMSSIEMVEAQKAIFIARDEKKEI